MPPIIKKRWRLKGHEVTVVILPRRKIRKKDKVLPSISLHVSVKEKGKYLCFCIIACLCDFYSNVEVVRG